MRLPRGCSACCDPNPNPNPNPNPKQVHVEHTPALPPSVASGFVARSATRTEAGEAASLG